jgi:hypothetical protein
MYMYATFTCTTILLPKASMLRSVLGWELRKEIENRREERTKD